MGNCGGRNVSEGEYIPTEKPVEYKGSLAQISVTNTDVLGSLTRLSQGRLLKMLAQLRILTQLLSDNPLSILMDSFLIKAYPLSKLSIKLT